MGTNSTGAGSGTARALGALSGALALVLLAACPAAAQTVRPFEGPFGPAAQPAFHHPAGMAVDQDTGEVYVVDVGVDEVQNVTVSAVEGQFRLRFAGEETSDIPFDASSTTVQTRLRNDIAAIGPSDVVVSGDPGDGAGSAPYVLAFQRGLGGADLPGLECADGTTPLAGGSGCTAETTTEGVNHAVRRFSADGTPSEFTALGSNAIDGRGGADQTERGGILRNFGGSVFAQEVQVALDESGGVTDGNIYVTDSFFHAIDVFSHDGEWIGQLTEYSEGEGAEGAGAELGEACGVAVDEAGAVYVGDFDNSLIHKYEPEGAVPADADSTANFTLNRACTVAAGAGPSAGYLFAVSVASGSSKPVFKLDSESGEVQYGGEPLAAGVHTTVSVAPASGRLLAATEDEVNEYNAAGPSKAGLELFWTETLPGAVHGVAANGGAELVHLSLAGDPNVRTYGNPAINVDAETLPAGDVGVESATLNGTVDPEGGTAVSECSFAYGQSDAYGEQAPCAEYESPPGSGEWLALEDPAELGEGSGPVAVRSAVEGLASGTEHHYRLSAANEAGARDQGNDESLTTLGPALGEAWASAVGVSEATLEAEIDPKGKATSLHVDYGPGESFAHSTPEREIGSGEGLQRVSFSLEGLAPGTAYSWRVVAGSDASAAGPERSFTTYRPLAHAPCPNDDLRAGPSTSLPDCRAYELVSPPDKGGGDIIARGSIEQALEAAYRQAAPGGERVTYTSTSAFAGAVASEAANQYLSARRLGGWSTESIQPPRGRSVPLVITTLTNTFFQAFTDDLCTALALDLNEEPLDPAGIAGFVNLNLYENCGAGGPEALTVGPAPEHASGLSLNAQGHNLTADGDHVVFGALADLASEPDPVPKDTGQVYDSVRTPGGRKLRRVSVLPGGHASPPISRVGSLGGAARNSNLSRALADDGSRVFWTSGAGRLYVRVNPAGRLGEETGECSEAAPGEACTTALSAGEATFWTATPDGSRAIYTEGESLLEVDVKAAIAGEAGASEEIAPGVGGLLGASEDLSRLYFTSTEDLAEGASEGESNVYLREAGGGLRYVASAEGAAGIDSARPISHPSRVSADGLRLAFQSRNPDLAQETAGYDSRDLDGGEPALEVYRYDAAAAGGAGELACVSCNPAGARGGTGEAPFNYRVDVSIAGIAAWLPTCEWSNHCKRTLADGADRVLFNAIDALVPEDRNGAQDVYQWEAPGTGTCTTSDPRYFPANRGCIHLISTGGGSLNSELLDASASGADAFFTTGSDIDPRDPGSVDLYDARIGGGFPPPPREADPCVGDACQSAPPSPEPPAIGSEAYAGPPDLGPARRCGAPARRARALSRRAKRLREGAGRAEAPRRSKRMRRKAKRLARRARKQSNRAKRCRRRARASGRAGL